jgi:hypothetical protein
MYVVGQEITPDFLIAVARGEVPGHSLVHKYGRNDAVPNGSWAHISLLPFTTTSFRQSAAAVRIKAGGNVADTAAGNGARSVFVQGVDSNFAELAEELATAGASASAYTSATFWRIHRTWVGGVGVYGAKNTGAILIEDGTNNLITVAAGEGQTQYAGWTVPLGKTAYLLSAHVTVDSNKTSNVRCFTRESIDTVAAPMKPSRLKLFWDGLQQHFVYKPYAPEFSLSAKTDIWFEGYGDGAVSQISVDFELLIVDD